MDAGRDALLNYPVADWRHSTQIIRRFVVVPRISHEIWTSLGRWILEYWGDAMTKRIMSKLSEKSYEAILGVCAACCVASLLLGGFGLI